MSPPLSTWPWENFGNFKYLLYGPLVGQVLFDLYKMNPDFTIDAILSLLNSWCLNLLILCALRGVVNVLWSSYSNLLYVTRNRVLNRNGVGFEQIDKEWHWDNFILVQALIASLVCYMFPLSESLPLWNSKGVVAVMALHVIVSEPLYYWIHTNLHGSYLFTHYHSLHHSSAVPQPQTAGHATYMEHLVLSVIIGIPLTGCCLMGFGSIGIIYCYVLGFDFLRTYGHCNVEFVPSKIFQILPFLKYLIYTPTYHSLHHEEMDTNFCLFMPLFDALGKTLNTKSWAKHEENYSNGGINSRVPGFVFLAHAVDISSALHQSFIFRSYASKPYKLNIWLIPIWPFAFVGMLIVWMWSKSFAATFYFLRGQLYQSWIIPRFVFMYFLPFAKNGINDQIEKAILRADRLGVKVISLAALNKNEALNGGGALFVKKLPDLKVRVVHGNTLTAAVILYELPSDVKEVFLTGATSKLGRAIALYLCRKKIRVLMLTLSKERFENIQREASPETQQYLVQVTKYQAAQHCKTWIVGKWLTPREQSWAPSGTHFHQFVVPPILPCRKSCTYGLLAAMRLPDDVKGLGHCEYALDRGVVHACHAGGVVHFLEGWTHHEVGAIDVDRIDIVWEAALRQGLRPLNSDLKKETQIRLKYKILEGEK